MRGGSGAVLNTEGGTVAAAVERNSFFERSGGDRDDALAWRTAEALEQLPAELKAVSVLRFIEGMSCRQVAKELDLPMEEVMRRQYEALRKINVLVHDEE